MYKKREIEEFKLLVSESSFLTENTKEMAYSANFPPELAGVLGAVGTATIGVGAIFAAFAGMSGAQIMAALAGFGAAGAVGGIASIAAAIAAPAVLVAGGLYSISNQNMLKRELKQLVDKSYQFEKLLIEDKRTNAIGVLKGMQEYRSKLLNKHKGLRRIQNNN